ncbi:MAG TPA: pilus assembly protein TadG-related protein [Acidimicrobiales bacterium]|jgi:Flp pilus assembly protein TadG|nr:pilus assembly protein TadG-related protein [Acidimicrobiales bacterium]
MLMPAAVLVLFILGAITFDYAHLYLAKRDLQAAAESAANDAVTFGVDQASVRRGDGVHLDTRLVVQAVEASLAAHGSGLHLVGPPEVEAIGATQVRVAVAGRVDFAFVGAVPGMARSSVVRASASATVVT